MPCFILQTDYKKGGINGELSLPINSDCALELFTTPPSTSLQLYELLSRCWSNAEMPEKEVMRALPDEAIAHCYAYDCWRMCKEPNWFDSNNHTTPKKQAPILFDIENFSQRIRLLLPLNSSADGLLDQWCTEFNVGISRIASVDQLLYFIADNIGKFIYMRPFVDGNCRISVLLIQGVLMSWGITPPHLTTRYCFMQSPAELKAYLLQHLRTMNIPSMCPIPSKLQTSVNKLC